MSNVSGMSAASSKRKIDEASKSTTSRADSVLKDALDALEKNQDAAQIFGDFIASSIRELDTEEKQQALKRALNRTLLDFQDEQYRSTQQQSHQQSYQPAYQPPTYSLPTHSQLPSYNTINPNTGSQNPFDLQTYTNM